MKAARLGFLTLVATLFLSVSIVLVESIMGNMGTANAQTSPYLSKTDAALELLLMMAEREDQLMAEREGQLRLTGALGEAVETIAKTQGVSVSIRFDHELGNGEIAELEAQGLIFRRINGEVAHSGTIYGAEMPLGIVDTLKERADVLRIESTWQPGVHDTLDLSVPEINADDMWQLLDAGGNNITGEGIIIADFDTGIDIFHPDFWKADGSSYAWLDTNSNNVFDPGTDAVDINGNGSLDSGETLDFFDAQGTAGNNDGVFQADMDWLYNDANGNGQRDYGTAAGFAEADPTYGELIFIVDDTNANNGLDVGESLIALGTSKVLRTKNVGGTERVRGTDLISTDPDTNGHGTSVCGILNGGIIGSRRYVGVAPNAELLVANRYANDFTVYIPWARTNGADVMLYEFGGWTGQFLDGSSNLEQAIDTEAAAGIVQVVPAGNLGDSDKHAQDDVAAAGGSTNFTFNVPGLAPAIDRIWITALWRDTGNDLAFQLTLPGMIVITVNLPATGTGTITTADGHSIWYRREDSTRGTAKYDILIQRATVGLGGWTLQVTNNHATNVQHVDMYIGDDQTDWAGGAVWTAFQSEDNTITRPATADSAITVASYSTRGWGVAAGDLSTFSPTGPRIDGQAIMDIAAPGNYDIASAISKDMDLDTPPDGPDFPFGSYRYFGGTSAAGPHVAAASALLLQWDPTLNHGQIKTMLQQGARTDWFTGATPNDEWGHGKLDVLAIVNEPPVCDANGPYTAECQTVVVPPSVIPVTMVSLDGTGSSDPNPGDHLTYWWTTDCPGGSFDDSTSPTPTLSVSPGCFDCTVSLTVTDKAGESDTCSAEVTITDTREPVITCPDDTTIECHESTDPANTGNATATDECDLDPAISFSDAITPSACPEEFTITRTWTATDDCGNVSSCAQTINVVDTTPPVIACNTPATITPKDAPISFTATATDNCDDDPSIEITGSDCFKFTKKGKQTDKTESCVVNVVGNTITILDSGGVADIIAWTTRAEDNCGNVEEITCQVEVVKKGKP